MPRVMRAWLVTVIGFSMSSFGATASSPTDVSLAVSVLDAGGRAISTLARSDFQVTDRGAPVQVVDVTWIPDRPSTLSRRAAAAPLGSTAVSDDEVTVAAREAGTRVVAIFLDEYHVAPDRAAGVRAGLAAAVRDFVQPQDLVLTVKPLDPLASLAFQRGSTAALAAIASFEGRLGDYEARNAFERELIAADPARIDRARTRIALSAIQVMATRLARLGSSRKALLIVSEPLVVSRQAAVRMGEALPSTDVLVRLAMRGNVSTSWLDPRDGDVLAAGAAVGAPDMLAELVRQTDGRVLRAGDRAGLSGWLDDLGGYYLLTLSGVDDGAFHPLDIRTAWSGARVRARPGYWAVSRDEIARIDAANAPPVPPRRVLPPVRASRLIVPWVGQSRAADGRMRVSFVWEPAPGRPGDRVRVLPPSRLVLRAQTIDGTTVFEGTVQAASAGLGASAEAHFDVTPGRLRLEMSIEDASARVLDTEVRDAVIAPLSGEVSIGTPRLFRTRSAREFAAVRADPDAPPAASRTFGRVERLLMRVPVYVNGEPASGTAPDVTVSLLNRMGQVMRQLPVEREPGSALVTTDLALAGLAAGEYSVQWRAALAAASAVETVSFRLVP